MRLLQHSNITSKSNSKPPKISEHLRQRSILNQCITPLHRAYFQVIIYHLNVAIHQLKNNLFVITSFLHDIILR